MGLSSSWMTVSGNMIGSTGTSNELFKRIDRLYSHISDSLHFAYVEVDQIDATEKTIAVGISVTPPSVGSPDYAFSRMDAREITITNNTLLDCVAQGVLTEGAAVDNGEAYNWYRVRDIAIDNNTIWTKPYVYIDSVLTPDGWRYGHYAQHWPTLWISDTDNCQVLDNNARCDHVTSWETEQNIWTAGIGITIDGCDSVRVEGNRFHGLTEAFRLRVDNQNGTFQSPNKPTNTRCVVRDNVFSGLRRDHGMGSFQGSHQGTFLASMGYQSRFAHLPAPSADITRPAFSGNVVRDNVLQIASLDTTASSPVVPCLLLNYPLTDWPSSPDPNFFTGHNCVGITDAATDGDLGTNTLAGNWFNLLAAADACSLSHAGMERYHHEVVDSTCQVQDGTLERHQFSLSSIDDPYPDSAIRTGNNWNCTFDSPGSLQVPELGALPLLAPVLRVPEDFATLQAAIDYAAEHHFPATHLEVSSPQLEAVAGNVNVHVPAGACLIAATDTTQIDARHEAGWLRLDPGANLTLTGFRLCNAGGNGPAILAQNAELTMVDTHLSSADSLCLVDTDCRLLGSSSWRDISLALQGNAAVTAKTALDWASVTLEHTGTPDTRHGPLLSLSSDIAEPETATLLNVSLLFSNGDGLAVAHCPVRLENCRLEGCAGSGLQATLGAWVKDVAGSYRHNLTGVTLLGSTIGADLVGSLIEENVGSGLFISYADLVTLDGVTVQGSGGQGLDLHNADIRLQHCVVADNAGDGINADHSHLDLSHFAANTLRDNAGAQVRFQVAEPSMMCGHNTISGSLPCLVEGNSLSDSLLSFQYNYWGQSAPQERVCLPAPVVTQLFPVCEEECLSGLECLEPDAPQVLLQ